jgi:hypothetical protein
MVSLGLQNLAFLPDIQPKMMVKFLQGLEIIQSIITKHTPDRNILLAQ